MDPTSPSSKTTRRLTTIALLTLGIYFLTGTLTTIWQGRPQQLHTSTRAPARKLVCLIYDKPPRTGSTTVAWALEACWSSRLKFEHHLYERDADNQVVRSEKRAPLTRLLSYSSQFVANIHRHISFGDAEIAALQDGCDNIFFVTNTRALHERVLSGAKALATLRTDGFNQNVTLDEGMLRRALADLRSKKAVSRAAVLTKRPFLGEQRLPVDYVIRSESLEEDTLPLLRAFGCPAYMSSTNHHMADPSITTDADEWPKVRPGSSAEAADQVVTEDLLEQEAKRLFSDDPRHEFYNAAAANNGKGLLRAAELAKLRMDSLGIQPV